MKGYEIFEIQYLKTYMGDDGILPYPIQIGLMDFLRELQCGADTIPKYTSYCIVGMDETIYLAAKEDRRGLARFIHQKLQSASQILDKKMVEIQIICKGRLYKADSFWLEYRSEKISLDMIFGTLMKRSQQNATVFYTGFNLSS